jgi:beta-N-acetylhexosaminidase
MSLGPLMVDVAGTALTREDREILAHPLVGSVILFTRNYADRTAAAAGAGDPRCARRRCWWPSITGAARSASGPVLGVAGAERIGHVYDLDADQGMETARRLGWLMAAAAGGGVASPCVAPTTACPRSSVTAPSPSRRIGGAARGGLHARYARRRHAGDREALPGHGAVVADSHLALPVTGATCGPAGRPDAVSLADRQRPAGRDGRHVPFPAVAAGELPARWVGGVRGELVTGAVFADDLSMAGAASIGDLVSRATQALSAGCDVLPVCNDRANLTRLLDGLKIDVDPASRLRLVRMRGRHGSSASELRASAAWQTCQDWLQRCTAAPQLEFDA